MTADITLRHISVTEINQSECPVPTPKTDYRTIAKSNPFYIIKPLGE